MKKTEKHCSKWYEHAWRDVFLVLHKAMTNLQHTTLHFWSEVSGKKLASTQGEGSRETYRARKWKY